MVDRWFHGAVGGGGPKLRSGERLLSNDFGTITKNALLDRFHAHTLHCKRCLKALSVIKALKTIVMLLLCSSIAIAVFTANLVWTGSAIANGVSVVL